MLNGEGGVDRLYGRLGDDAYFVDNAGDLVFETAGQGTDVVVTAVNYALQAGQAVEILRFANPTSTQGATLIGNEVANRVIGSDGADALDGRAGADILTGRAGADNFLFSTQLGAGNIDHITDFSPVDDTIRLDDAIFTALKPGALPKGAFKAFGFPDGDPGDRITYNLANGALAYDPDGSGSAPSRVFAILDNRPNLTAADFLVV